MQKDIVPIESVTQAIHTVRGQRVILDADLAALYGVEVRTLNQAVKRNLYRFPDDFSFVLTPEEAESLRSQNVILKKSRGQHRKYLPRAFTEHGAIMAANVLNSPHAVQMSVEVVRAFIRLRRAVLDYKELAARMNALEAKYDKQFAAVFQAIRQLMAPPEPKRKRIGFTKPE